MELKELALDLRDFNNFSIYKNEKILEYKMLGKYSEEDMMKYVDEINKKINQNINKFEEFLNSITNEFELVCILSKLINDYDTVVKLKMIYPTEYYQELSLIYLSDSLPIRCKTENQVIQVIELFKKIGGINNLPKDSWKKYKNKTCYYIDNDNNISYNTVSQYRSDDDVVNIDKHFLIKINNINQLEEKLKTSITV